MALEHDAPQMIDAYGVQDVFITGLGSIEQVGGGCLRFVFFSEQHSGDRDERFVVARLVLPMEAVGPAALAALKAIGMKMITDPASCKPN
jgi:hypothetical protein